MGNPDNAPHGCHAAPDSASCCEPCLDIDLPARPLYFGRVVCGFQNSWNPFNLNPVGSNAMQSNEHDPLHLGEP